jgi:hypothetical protein
LVGFENIRGFDPIGGGLEGRFGLVRVGLEGSFGFAPSVGLEGRVGFEAGGGLPPIDGGFLATITIGLVGVGGGAVSCCDGGREGGEDSVCAEVGVWKSGLDRLRVLEDDVACSCFENPHLQDPKIAAFISSL